LIVEVGGTISPPVGDLEHTAPHALPMSFRRSPDLRTCILAESNARNTAKGMRRDWRTSQKLECRLLESRCSWVGTLLPHA